MRIFGESSGRPLRDERGITGIETGVLLGALAAASSLIAAVVINAGVTASHQLDASVSAAMLQVDGGLMVSGPAIVRTDGTKATAVIIDVRALGGQPVDLSGANGNGLTLRYLTNETIAEQVPFAVAFAHGNGDDLLNPARRPS